MNRYSFFKMKDKRVAQAIIDRTTDLDLTEEAIGNSASSIKNSVTDVVLPTLGLTGNNYESCATITSMVDDLTLFHHGQKLLLTKKNIASAAAYVSLYNTREEVQKSARDDFKLLTNLEDATTKEFLKELLEAGSLNNV